MSWEFSKHRDSIWLRSVSLFYFVSAFYSFVNASYSLHWILPSHWEQDEEREWERERSIDDAFHLAWINRLQTVSIRYLIWLANTWHKKEYITAMKRFTRCGFIGFLCVSVLFVRWIWQLICQHMKWERKSGKTHTHAQRHTHTAHNEWGEMLWELFNSANVGKLCRGIWIQRQLCILIRTAGFWRRKFC